MRYLALALAVCLCACSPKGSTSGDGVIDIEPNTTAPTQVLMGDSITYRWDFANPSIAQLLPQANDEGVSGNDTAAMLARFQADVIDYHPSVVVILGGTNDLIEGSTDITNVMEMGQMAQAAGIKVVLCTIPPSPIFNADLVGTWNVQIKSLASSEGWGIADYAAAAWSLADFQTDHEHPNDSGFALMWPVLQAALKQ